MVYKFASTFSTEFGFEFDEFCAMCLASSSGSPNIFDSVLHEEVSVIRLCCGGCVLPVIWTLPCHGQHCILYTSMQAVTSYMHVSVFM